MSSPHSSFPNFHFAREADATKAIFCELKIGIADVPELKRMARESSTYFGFDSLAKDLAELADPSSAPEYSSYHPKQDPNGLHGRCPPIAE